MWTSIAMFLGIISMPTIVATQARAYPAAKPVRELRELIPDMQLDAYEPRPIAPKMSPLDELKASLRIMCYGDFVEAAKGMGFEPKKAWAWATSTEEFAFA